MAPKYVVATLSLSSPQEQQRLEEPKTYFGPSSRAHRKPRRHDAVFPGCLVVSSPVAVVLVQGMIVWETIVLRWGGSQW